MSLEWIFFHKSFFLQKTRYSLESTTQNYTLSKTRGKIKQEVLSIKDQQIFRKGPESILMTDNLIFPKLWITSVTHRVFGFINNQKPF